MCKPRRLKDKIKSLKELKKAVDDLKEQGKKVVFTNGCYDLIHAGHVDLLERAGSYGDVLVVAVNSDISVRAIKGEKRPIVPQSQRAAVVGALEAVDFVVIFDDRDPLGVVEALVPDVLVKGGDWTPDTIIGRDVVEQAGGRVLSIPLLDGISTTGIIDDIRKKYYHD